MEFVLTEEQKKWAERGKRGASAAELRALVVKQSGLCALSSVTLLFNKKKDGTAIAEGEGCHPLYAAVDHIDPGNPKGGHQIICYALNDLKGHLPVECFEALKGTEAWRDLMRRWRELAERDSTNRKAFRRLLRPNAN